MALPAGFMLGISTSAWQIEGATRVDGRGPSIWDTFAAAPRAIADGHTPDVACDHYHRFEEDLDLVAAAGVDAYRFSIAWPRVVPQGRGAVNERGLAFYDRLVDAVLARGLQPVACLYHWDLPQALQEGGGWAARETAEALGEYAHILGGRLGDRVALWATLNEPFIHLSRGHVRGDHAPGEQRLTDWAPVGHHLCLGHARATAALREAGVKGGVGIIVSVSPTRPVSDEPADAAAAEIFDALSNHSLLAPVLEGAYPPEVLAAQPRLGELAMDADMAAISARLDFLGVNYYQPTGIAAAPEGAYPPFIPAPLDLPRTGMGMAVDPGGLREALAMLAARYGERLPPILVTEIGCAYPETPGSDGRCVDADRIAYLDSYLRALLKAIDDGADVRGCFVWSLLDNFEWECGFTQRFGLVRVDFDTLERTPKASYDWLARLARERTLPAAEPAAR